MNFHAITLGVLIHITSWVWDENLQIRSLKQVLLNQRADPFNRSLHFVPGLIGKPIHHEGASGDTFVTKPSQNGFGRINLYSLLEDVLASLVIRFETNLQPATTTTSKCLNDSRISQTVQAGLAVIKDIPFNFKRSAEFKCVSRMQRKGFIPPLLKPT